jgi:hypothetical protein
LIANEDMKPISPRTLTECPSVEHVFSGIPIPKQLRVTTFSSGEWESFTEEWATSLKDIYARVARFGGSGDFGVDVVGFVSDTGWYTGWDNYQCKHYGHALRPSDIWIEIGKIIYYSYKNEYPVPRKYYFIASQNVGTSLNKLLANPEKLKEEAKDNWEKHCQTQITKTTSIPLKDDLLDWFEAFDFSIFSTKSIVELLEGHAKTSFHSIRFGGGLPPRPTVIPPPEDHDVTESRYIQHLFGAYGDRLKKTVDKVSDLSLPLNDDFLRQRERFYHAESLRNFARDTVPNGTFEALQEEIFHGVIDVCNDIHNDGLTRMQKTVTHSAQISITSNPLVSAVKVQDRQGICHQLANEDRLIWVPTIEEVSDDISI